MIAPVRHEARPGRLLTEGWTLTLTEADACFHPSAIPHDADTISAPVPGTVAQALEAAGRFNRLDPEPLDGFDAWYRLTLISEGPQRAILSFDGLSTIAEIYLNGTVIANSTSMFEATETTVHLTGADELAICFRALAPRLERGGPRARWRPQMMDTQGLRMIRTTVLGHMPGWCPSVHAAGPWRPIRLTKEEDAAFTITSFRTELEESGTGVIHISVEPRTSSSRIELGCADHWIELNATASGILEGTLRIDDVEPWWPLSHGRAALHEVTLRIDGRSHRLGKTGFRRIAIDEGPDGKGFGLTINGQPVFCRGAVWTSADIVRLPGERKDYEPWLRLAAEAGMNMIRIGGTMAYETPEFFALCDELGLMVWQDMMLANYDYPAKDERFLAHLETETAQHLANTALSPSLVLVCGGSEMYQQGAMLGLSEAVWKGPLTENILSEAVKRHRPDVAYVPNSPFGGALPFLPNEKVGHYYGVGAYCRPLEDARRAEVRFAAECLAFANVPQQKTLDAHLPVKAVHDPLWKARVPRDRGASWDFEDVRDHYLEQLYHVDPQRLRREDGAHYIDLSRAAVAEVMEATFGEWRRDGSSCRGALVWTLQDLLPGAGWGIIDALGEPKSPWYALKRAFRPVQLMLTDEGTNGLLIHLVNEAADAKNVIVEITCLRDGLQPVVTGRKQLDLPARGKTHLAATDLFGAFFDTTYAYRFGPPSHDVTVARLLDGQTSEIIAQAYHFPLGRDRAMHAAVLETDIHEEAGAYRLVLRSDRFAQSVHIDIAGFRPEDDWFHLAPNETRTITLFETGGDDGGRPEGTVRSLGSRRIFRF